MKILFAWNQIVQISSLDGLRLSDLASSHPGPCVQWCILYDTNNGAHLMEGPWLFYLYRN